MAKIRHRTFEIFDFLLEASDALASKSARAVTYETDPHLWNLHLLEATLRPSGVIHLTFKQLTDDAPQSKSDLGKDLADLAELLANDSRVLLDFEGVQEFDSDAITRLKEFDGKLRSKGSRIVLCNLESTVRAAFFPQLSAKNTSR